MDTSCDFSLMIAVHFDRNLLSIFGSITGFHITDNVNKQDCVS